MEEKDADRQALILPAYQVAEASRLTGAKRQTIASWFRAPANQGHHATRPVPLLTPKAARKPISFLQLIEVAVVARFRTLGVPLQRIRKAKAYLSDVFKTEYPFVVHRLKTEGAHVYKGYENQGRLAGGSLLIVADRRGQLTWPELIAGRLEEFDYRADGFATRWFPRGRSVPVIVDPRYSFGAPVLKDSYIATWALNGRLDAGESPSSVARDFGISEREVEIAVEFERAAA